MFPSHHSPLIFSQATYSIIAIKIQTKMPMSQYQKFYSRSRSLSEQKISWLPCQRSWDQFTAVLNKSQCVGVHVSMCMSHEQAQKGVCVSVCISCTRGQKCVHVICTGIEVCPCECVHVICTGKETALYSLKPRA